MKQKIRPAPIALRTSVNCFSECHGGAGVGLGCDVCDIGGIARLCGLSGFIFKVRIFIKFLLISHSKQTSAFKPRDTAGGGEKACH